MGKTWPEAFAQAAHSFAQLLAICATLLFMADCSGGWKIAAGLGRWVGGP